MNYILQNPKILGSFVVGFALVSLSYVISNFGQGRTQPVATVAVAQAEAPERVFIAVEDADGNGIEDWREEFVNREPIVVAAGPEQPPQPFEATTLTEQLAVNYFEAVIRNQSLGPAAQPSEDVVAETMSRVQGTVQDRIYTGRDIAVIPSSPAAIRTYGNTMGQILINNNVPDYEDALTILDRGLRLEDQEEIAKLAPLALMYQNLRDQSLRTPVPEPFVKQHLDLINVYHALHMSLSDMQKALEDPVVALLRIKRYQDDATGLAAAMQNMYYALIPHASLFTERDPAVVFVLFSPDI